LLIRFPERGEKQRSSTAWQNIAKPLFFSVDLIFREIQSVTGKETASVFARQDKHKKDGRLPYDELSATIAFDMHGLGWRQYMPPSRHDGEGAASCKQITRPATIRIA